MPSKQSSIIHVEACHRIQDLEHQLRFLDWESRIPAVIQVNEKVSSSPTTTTFALSDVAEARGTGTVIRQLERLHVEAAKIHASEVDEECKLRLNALRKEISFGRARFQELLSLSFAYSLRAEDDFEKQLMKLKDRYATLKASKRKVSDLDNPTVMSMALTGVVVELQSIIAALHKLALPSHPKWERGRLEFLQEVEKEVALTRQLRGPQVNLG